MRIAFAAGAIFTPAGALMAGVITYIEYAKHPLPRRQILIEAFRSAVFAGFVLLLLTGIFGWLMAGDRAGAAIPRPQHVQRK